MLKGPHPPTKMTKINKLAHNFSFFECSIFSHPHIILYTTLGLFRITYYVSRFDIQSLTHDLLTSLGVNCTESVKKIFSFLFSTKVNSRSLDPMDDPFKSP